MHGLSALLSSIRRDALDDETERSVYYSIYMEEVCHRPVSARYLPKLISCDIKSLEAIVSNRSSHFDDPYWLRVSPPRGLFKASLDGAAQSVMQQCVELPRLMVLLRCHLEEPHDDELRACVLDLLNLLRSRDSKINATLQECIVSEDEICLVSFSWPQDTPDVIDPRAYRMASVQVYHLCIQYWMTRIWLRGLMQRLHSAATQDHNLGSCSLVRPLLGDDELYSDEIEAAINLAKCFPFAFGRLNSIGRTVSSSSRSLLPPQRELLGFPLRLALSLQISFGTWHRLEQRLLHEPLNSSLAATDGRFHLDIDKVRHVKSWLLKRIHECQKMWHIRFSLYEELERKVEIMAGAPFDPSVWASRYK